jgi:hypothetical protein
MKENEGRKERRMKVWKMRAGKKMKEVRKEER